jgi:hypothetical protein
MQETANLAPDRKMDIERLNEFIVRAKAATYVGDSEHAAPSRAGSHELRFEDGDWAYHDSYFGGTDFIGQEVVYWAGQPVWGMNYYGRILYDDQITAAETGQMIKSSLSRMYREGRFLGGFEHKENGLFYVDLSQGSIEYFQGRETIRRGQLIVYELEYHGGLIRD